MEPVRTPDEPNKRGPHASPVGTTAHSHGPCGPLGPLKYSREEDKFLSPAITDYVALLRVRLELQEARRQHLECMQLAQTVVQMLSPHNQNRERFESVVRAAVATFPFKPATSVPQTATTPNVMSTLKKRNTLRKAPLGPPKRGMQELSQLRVDVRLRGSHQPHIKLGGTPRQIDPRQRRMSSNKCWRL